MSHQRAAEVKRLKLPNMNGYARQSADQEAIENYLKEHGARQLSAADNSGKTMSFNGRSGKGKGVNYASLHK